MILGGFQEKRVGRCARRRCAARWVARLQRAQHVSSSCASAAAASAARAATASGQPVAARARLSTVTPGYSAARLQFVGVRVGTQDAEIGDHRARAAPRDAGARARAAAAEKSGAGHEIQLLRRSCAATAFMMTKVCARARRSPARRPRRAGASRGCA